MSGRSCSEPTGGQGREGRYCAAIVPWPTDITDERCNNRKATERHKVLQEYTMVVERLVRPNRKYELENRRPKGLVGSNPTPSASNSLRAI